ncbi:hypothetical protein I4U23_015514 [Adineta vaga]|nr:hypothetical protein I4U23_015514 [Adineta vaga]
MNVDELELENMVIGEHRQQQHEKAISKSVKIIQSWRSNALCATKMKLVYTVLALLAIASVSIVLLMSHRTSKMNDNPIFETEQDTTRIANDRDDSNLYQETSQQLNEVHEDEQMPQLRSYDRYEVSSILFTLDDIYLYAGNKDLDHTNVLSSQRLRFPVAHYTRRHNPFKSSLMHFMPWIPIFADRRTKQTIIFSQTGGVYILPPLINMYGKMYSVAELIASGYASLVSSGVPPTSNIDMFRFFHPQPLFGPSIPIVNPHTGIFRGGIHGKFGSFPLSTSNSKYYSEDYSPEREEDNYDDDDDDDDDDDGDDNYNDDRYRKNLYENNKRPHLRTKYPRTTTATTRSTKITKSTKKPTPTTPTTSNAEFLTKCEPDVVPRTFKRNRKIQSREEKKKRLKTKLKEICSKQIMGSRQRLKNAVMVEFASDSKDKDYAKKVLETLTKNDRTRSLSVKIRQKFNSEAIHGVSISVNDESTLETLADLDEVVEFHPITIVPAPKPMKYFTASDKLKDGNLQPILPHAISGVSKLHEQFQNYVVDSGIDYNHPTLGGCFRTEGCKIEDGYDFVGDSYGAADPIPKPDNDPYDGCPDGGHGTHVAGIIAGNSSGTKDSFYTPVTPFLGVAPQATLLIYRVGGCPGEIGSDVFAQAILTAYEAKADISDSPYPTDIFAIAVDYVTSKGVYTTVCAGNEGEYGIQTIVTPSIATAAISVASVDNTHTVKFILIAPNGRKIPYLAGHAFSNEQSTFQSKIVVNDPDRGVSDGCNGPKISVAGVVVLFANNPNDMCTISERCMKAAEAGAIGCLIDDPSLTGAFITVPNGIISLEDAQFITKTVSKNPDGIYQFTNSFEMISMATSVKPSIFTSIGPRIDLEFKPDIGAVGGFVYSTVTTNVAKYLGLPSAYAVWSGTSMSTPYMAGVLALFLSHIGNPAPSTVDGVSSDGKCRPKPSVARDLFQSTSKILKDDDSSLVEPPLRQGAGFVDAYYAITTKAFFSPAKLSLNDTVNKKESYTVRLFNIGQQPARYKLSHQGAPMTTGMEPNNDLLLRNPVYTEDYAVSIRLRYLFLYIAILNK